MEARLFSNLAEFDRDSLRPSSAAFSRATLARERAYSFADMVACFFWLLLGLDTEYFQIDHAESLFSQRFVHFVVEFGELDRKYGYVLDPEFEPLLVGALNNRRLVQRVEAERIYAGPIATAALRSALLAERGLKKSDDARSFLSFLNFEPDTLTKIVSAGIVVPSPDGTIVNQDSIASGFTDVISYMRSLIELAKTLHLEGPDTVGRRCEYRLRQLTRWRVNRHSAIDGPFMEVALFVNDKYLGGAYSNIQIANEMESLLNDWGFSNSKTMGGSA